MTLRELLAGATLESPVPESVANADVRGLEYDSRKVEPGYLFFAFPGARVDGREFAAQAVAQGAIAVISELPQPEGLSSPPSSFTWIQVAHGRHALALAARAFYGNLDRKIALTGITGTNGKTTTSFLIDSILRAAGKTTALVGTIE
ncbi:MAG TPA: Mur ligase domain-containing protein, partial [Bryobacteraceae bacterium]|nr:Mur ligase domain-containing protein [Bryobacteraceae bacterium]